MTEPTEASNATKGLKWQSERFLEPKESTKSTIWSEEAKTLAMAQLNIMEPKKRDNFVHRILHPIKSFPISFPPKKPFNAKDNFRVFLPMKHEYSKN